ncbi:MAG TPA: ABC-type transport auxiliary lipoprotein family protein [Beijerinckiaceae bacterium]|nr:ABC-type transport auxiliary lipoprotein family protein [Beijerinckiaceae bacterium]
MSGVAMAALAGACSSSPPTTYDLSAPRQAARGGGGSGAQIAVAEPVAVQALEADRILVKDSSGAISTVGGAQWADRLPRLIQARLIQTFENASRIRAVSRPSDRITPDYQLTSEIRAFQIDASTSQAVVEMSVKLVNDRNGRIATARVFSARSGVASINAENATKALDRALSSVLLQIVRWVGTGQAPSGEASVIEPPSSTAEPSSSAATAPDESGTPSSQSAQL